MSKEKNKSPKLSVSAIIAASTLLLIIVGLFIFIFKLYIDDVKNEIVCSKFGVITSIDSVHHRTAYYTVDSTTKLSSYEAQISVGDKICLSQRKVPKIDNK